MKIFNTITKGSIFLLFMLFSMNLQAQQVRSNAFEKEANLTPETRLRLSKRLDSKSEQTVKTEETTAPSVQDSSTKGQDPNRKSAKKAEKPVIDYVKLKAVYNQNLIKDYEREIGKKIIATADFNEMPEQKKTMITTESNKYLVVNNPLKEAQTYFTQKKSN